MSVNQGELEFMKYNYCFYCGWIRYGYFESEPCWENCEAFDEALEELRAGNFTPIEEDGQIQDQWPEE